MTIIDLLGRDQSHILLLYNELRKRLCKKAKEVTFDAEKFARIPFAIGKVGDTYSQNVKRIDDYYADRSGEADSVLTALVERLAAPRPRDSRVIEQLGSYRGLDARWHDWHAVESVCQELSDGLLRAVEP